MPRPRLRHRQLLLTALVAVLLLFAQSASLRHDLHAHLFAGEAVVDNCLHYHAPLAGSTEVPHLVAPTPRVLATVTAPTDRYVSVATPHYRSRAPPV